MSNTVATTQQQLSQSKDVEKMLMSGKAGLVAALPKGMNVDRFLRTVFTEIRNNPDLQKCDPISVCTSVVKAAQLGLEVGKDLGQAYLIPYGNECSLQIGYKGDIQLAYRSEKILDLSVHEVKEGDEFSYQYGTDPKITHKPGMKRGAITHVYATCRLKTGGLTMEVMSVDEIERHRDTYARGANRADSPWKKEFGEMAKKTVLSRLIKFLPINVESVDLDATPPNPQKYLDIMAAPEPVPPQDREAYLKMIENVANDLAARGVPPDEIFKVVPLEHTTFPTEKLVAIYATLKQKLDQCVHS